MSQVEERLAALGITLPQPNPPVANYVPFVKSGNMLVVSGQLCFGADGKLAAKGQLGGGVSIEDGQKAARACASPCRPPTRRPTSTACWMRWRRRATRPRKPHGGYRPPMQTYLISV